MTKHLDSAATPRRGLLRYGKLSFVAGVLITCMNAVGGETGVWTATANSGDWATASNWENEFVPINDNDSASFPTGVPTTDGFLNSIRLVTMPDSSLTLDSLSGESGTTLVGQATPRTFSFLTAVDFLGTFKLAYPHTISFRADAGATAYAPRVNAAGKTVVDVPNADGTLELTSLYGNARADKSGPGTLRIVNGGGQQTQLTVKEASTVELVGAPSDMTATADDLPAPFLWFDADVEASLTTEDGTVTKWIDVRSVTDNESRRYLAKWDQIDCPLLVSNAANGHAVLDFGKQVSGSGGRALKLSADYTVGLGHPELFIAFECSDPTNNPILFSDTLNKKYQTDDNVGYDIRLFSTTELNPGTRNGEMRLDGNQMWYSDTYRPRGGFRTLMIANAQLGANRFQGFGCDRANRRGGMRIGEILIYSSPLTSDQRRRVRNYLQRKWCSGDNAAEWELGVVQLRAATTVSVPAGRVARVQKISTSTAKMLTVAGGGTLETALIGNPPRGRRGGIQNGAFNSADPMPVTISPGATLRIVPGVEADADAPLPAAPYIHLDASQPDTITESDGVVTEWRDVRSDSTMRAVAMNNGTYHVTRGVGKMNGRDVVSTGTLMNNPTGVGLDIYNGETQAGMYASSCREAFIAGRAERAGDGWGRALFLSNHSRRTFWPGRDNGDDNQGGLITGYYASIKINEGCTPAQLDNYIALDGIPVDPSSYIMITNWVLISTAFRETQQFNSLARYSTSMRGGVEYGEVLVYNRSLTPQERRNVEAYMLKKWRGIDVHPENAPVKTGALSVESGATLAIASGAGVSVAGNLSVGSGATLKVESLSATAPLAASGTATFANAGVIDISGVNLENVDYGRYPIVSAGTIAGSPDKWNITMPENGNAKIRIDVKDNLVTLLYVPRGTILLIK